MDDASYSTNVDIGTSMIIYALNVNGAVGFEYNMNIVAGDAAVSASVYEGRGYTVVFFVVRHLILYTCRMYGTFRTFRYDSMYVAWWKRTRATPLCCID
jgi:hypothetical protein